MGIPFFRKGLLVRVDRSSIDETPVPDDVKAIYIDANSIFHTAARHLYDVNGRFDSQKAADVKEACELIIRCFETVINYYGPTEVVYISVDGVVPMTKIQQQKERRYESGAMLQEGGYNSTFITPGTGFMIALDEALSTWVDGVQRSTTRLRRRVKRFVYSSHLDPGEGEHKIMEYMRANDKQVGTQIIYGNDSDLLLLALALNVPGLYVCKDTVDLYDAAGGRIKTDGEKPINIDELRLGLVDHLRGDRVDDFIFACTLLGNDFLPRSPLFANIADGIATIITLIAEGNTLGTLDGMVEFFRTLSALESFQTVEERELPANMHNVLRHVQKRHVFVNNRAGVSYLTFRSPIMDAVALYEDPAQKDSALPLLWYAKMFPLTDEVSSAVGLACLEYIRGLYWVSSYYRSGQSSVTWLWFYPYHYAPLLSDLDRVLAYLTPEEFQSLTKVSPVPEERKFTPLHQMLSVMPWQSVHLLPVPLPEMFYNSTSLLIDMMPIDVTVDLELTEAAHQGKVIVPFARYYDIMHYVSLREFPSVLLSSLSYKGPLTRLDTRPSIPEQRRAPRDAPVVEQKVSEEGDVEELRDSKSLPPALERRLPPEERGRGRGRGRGDTFGGRGGRGDTFGGGRGDTFRGGRGDTFRGGRGDTFRGGRGDTFRGGQKASYRTEGKDVVRR